MSFSEVKELLERFEAGSIREMDLQLGDVSLYLSKNEGGRYVAPERLDSPQTVTAPETRSNSVVESTAIEDSPSIIEELPLPGETVNSPIVGVIYTSSEPGAPAFKQVGDTVAVGDTLCIVEAMKIMNDVTSDKNGIVTEILINNEDVVEYGQPLFRIS